MGYSNLVYIFGGVDSPRRGTRLSTCAVSWGGPAHCIPANVGWQIAGGLLTVLLPWPSMYAHAALPRGLLQIGTTFESVHRELNLQISLRPREVFDDD